jgi:hypothetical protein
MSTPKTNRREKAEETRRIAEALGVKERQARQLKASGLTPGAAGDLNGAKFQKTLLECEKLRHQIAVAEGNYIARSKVREDGLRIGDLFTAELAALLNDAPGLLAGLSELDLRQKLEPRLELMKENLQRELAKSHDEPA